jgi:hypothetical protein
MENQVILDGSLYALTLIFEDHAEKLEKEEGGRYLEILFPKLLNFYNHPTVEV